MVFTHFYEFFLDPFFVSGDDANVTTKNSQFASRIRANSHCFLFDISKGRLNIEKHGFVVKRHENLYAFKDGVKVLTCTYLLIFLFFILYF